MSGCKVMPLTRKIYCVYNAADEELNYEDAQRGGFPANKVTPVGDMLNPVERSMSQRVTKSPRLAITPEETRITMVFVSSGSIKSSRYE